MNTNKNYLYSYKARLEYSAASNLLFHFKFNWLLTFCQ